jgi:hypothetical protein
LSDTALDQMADAAAHATLVFAQTTSAIEGTDKGKGKGHAKEAKVPRLSAEALGGDRSNDPPLGAADTTAVPHGARDHDGEVRRVALPLAVHGPCGG